MNTPQVPAGADTGSPRIEGIDVPKVSAWIAAHTDITAPLTFKLIAGGRSNMTFTVTDAAGIAADVHHAVDGIGDRRPVEIGGRRPRSISRFDAVTVDAQLGGGVAGKSGKIPDKLQIRPNSGRGIIAA